MYKGYKEYKGSWNDDKHSYMYQIIHKDENKTENDYNEIYNKSFEIRMFLCNKTVLCKQ